MQMPKMIPTPIDTATDEQIKQFAENTGVEINPGDDAETIKTKVFLSLGGSETIFVLQMPEDPAAAVLGTPPGHSPGAREAPRTVPGAMHGSLGHEDSKVRIRISNEERNGELYRRDIEVGVNGRCWQLRREVPIDIPYRVFMALEGAITDSVTIDQTPGGGHPEVHTDVKRIPYSVIAFPSTEEIAAWRERTDDVELV